MVYNQYLKIDKFVWARVLCGTRYYQCASLDCSETIQKILMSKIQMRQGYMTSYNCEFWPRRPLDVANWTLHKQKVSVDAQI